MRSIPSQIERQGPEDSPFGPPQLLTARELCDAIGVTPGWVYKRTKKGAIDPLPVVRLGRRGIRFDPYKVSTISALARGTGPMLRWNHPTELPESTERRIEIDSEAISDRQCPVA